MSALTDIIFNMQHSILNTPNTTPNTTPDKTENEPTLDLQAPSTLKHHQAVVPPLRHTEYVPSQPPELPRSTTSDRSRKETLFRHRGLLQQRARPLPQPHIRLGRDAFKGGRRWWRPGSRPTLSALEKEMEKISDEPCPSTAALTPAMSCTLTRSRYEEDDDIERHSPPHSNFAEPQGGSR